MYRRNIQSALSGDGAITKSLFQKPMVTNTMNTNNLIITV